jgi:hypothetical protein
MPLYLSKLCRATPTYKDTRIFPIPTFLGYIIFPGDVWDSVVSDVWLRFMNPIRFATEPLATTFPRKYLHNISSGCHNPANSICYDAVQGIAEVNTTCVRNIAKHEDVCIACLDVSVFFNGLEADNKHGYSIVTTNLWATVFVSITVILS